MMAHVLGASRHIKNLTEIVTIWRQDEGGKWEQYFQNRFSPCASHTEHWDNAARTVSFGMTLAGFCAAFPEDPSWLTRILRAGRAALPDRAGGELHDRRHALRAEALPPGMPMPILKPSRQHPTTSC